MIQIRAVNLDADYPLCASWWTGHGAPVVPLAVLPKCGWFATQDGEPVAVVWMDFSNNRGAAVLLWWTTKPGNSRALSFIALAHLTRHAEGQAAGFGYGGLVAVAPAVGGLVPFLERMGFDGGTKVPHVHLVKFLPINPKFAALPPPA